MKLACFSWLGVSYYLSRSTIVNILSSIAGLAAPGSSIVFDYLDAAAFVAGKSAQRVQILLLMAQGVGENMVMVIDPAELQQETVKLGLTLHEDPAPAEVQQRYFAGRGDNYYACEHAHLACVLV